MKTDNKKPQKKGDTKSGRKITGRKKRKKPKNTKELLPYNNNISKKKTVKKKKKKKRPPNPNAGRKWFDGKKEDAVITKLEQVWSIDGSDAEAALYADISTASLSRYLKEHKDISERKEALKHRPVLKARQSVVNGLDNSDFALKYLERKRSNEFSLKTKVEQSGSVDNNLLFTDADLFLKKTKPKKKK